MSEPVFAFVRLENPVMLEDFCEINKPTRLEKVLEHTNFSNKITQIFGSDLGTTRIKCSAAGKRKSSWQLAY